MKIVKVASSYLDACRPKDELQSKNVYNITKDRKPIITPIISASESGSSEDGQQFVLIPNSHGILVKSLEHGKNVCFLDSGDDFSDEEAPSLNTATIMTITKGSMSREESSEDNDAMEIDTSPTEYIVVGGFSDGSMREWNLSAIPYANKTGSIMPRRTFKFGFNGCVTHVTSPSGRGNELAYALITTDVSGKRSTKLISFSLPVCDDLSEVIILDVDHIARFCTKNDSKKRNSAENADDANKNNNLNLSSLPFTMMSTSADKGNGEKEYFLGFCHRNGFVIYHEGTGSFVSFPKTQSDSHICAAAMSPNGTDIALGYESGKIDVLTSVLTQTADYATDGISEADKKHPQDSLVIRTIHWHALPVKTLCYLGTQGSRATPILLSGGEEAVLVTWSIDRGLNRPSHTLPRIARGCITHIATNSHPDSSSASVDIIVKCMDETLQLIQGFNHAIRWKVQGLACALNECAIPVEPSAHAQTKPAAILKMDPKSKVPIITRMDGAPGLIHWFDPRSNEVVGELEVCAYNRISRKEANHKSYPRPTVTHLAVSKSGNDLITVDTMLSENMSVGNFCKVKSFTSNGDDKSEEMSFVTNIKFWTWSKEMEKNAGQRGQGMPYELIAAMPAPHGIAKGYIDALAMSPDGKKACTLSKEEGAFHIWEKGSTSGVRKGHIVPSWKRLCKISIPAGLSNVGDTRSDQRKDLISFSPDGSVVAIVLGRHITLWDHTNATMLNTLKAPELINGINFLRTPYDMIVATGVRSLSVLPPFGSGYLGKDKWSYMLGEGEKMQLDMVTPLIARKEIAIAFTQKARDGSITTKVTVLDLATAKAKRQADGSPISWDLKGTLQSLTDVSHFRNEWSSDEIQDPALVALTSDNQMFVLEGNSCTPLKNEDNDTFPRGSFSRIENTKSVALTSRTAPKIENTKRRRIMKDKSAKEQLSTNPMAGALLFDQNATTSESGQVPTSQLPALSGSFARSFIARNIKKSS